MAKLRTEEVHLHKLPDGTTLRVKIIVEPEFKLRFWAFKTLVWLACWISGCAVEYERND